MDLFFLVAPKGEIADEERLDALNQALAQLYEEEAAAGGGSGALDGPAGRLAPLELVPQGPHRLAAFRGHVHRSLAAFCPDWRAKDRALRRLATEVQKPRPPPRKAVEPPAPGAEGVLLEEGVVALPPCWPPATMGMEQVRELLSGLGGAGGKESAAAYGAAAADASKKALQLARDYGLSALVASRSFREGLMAGDTATAALSLLRRLAPGAPGGGGAGEEAAAAPAAGPEPAPPAALALKPAAGEAAGLRPPMAARSVARAEEASPSPSPSQPPSPSRRVRFEQPRWRFDAGDGLHMDIRALPDVRAPRTGQAVWPGEVFGVDHEEKGRDGILYLHLADGRGWVFAKKPGVGRMCVRVA